MPLTSPVAAPSAAGRIFTRTRGLRRKGTEHETVRRQRAQSQIRSQAGTGAGGWSGQPFRHGARDRARQFSAAEDHFGRKAGGAPPRQGAAEPAQPGPGRMAGSGGADRGGRRLGARSWREDRAGCGGHQPRRHAPHRPQVPEEERKPAGPPPCGAEAHQGRPRPCR